MSEFHGLNRLWGKYPDFDIEGKRIFLEHMDHILERLRVFNMRLKLTDDAAVKEYMSTVNKQLMFMSTNTDALYGGKLRVENVPHTWWPQITRHHELLALS